MSFRCGGSICEVSVGSSGQVFAYGRYTLSWLDWGFIAASVAKVGSTSAGGVNVVNVTDYPLAEDETLLGHVGVLRYPQ